MKYLLVLLVVVIGLFALLGRGRRTVAPPDAEPPARKPKAPPPAAMLACARCGVHLPQDEALRDPEGRVYCGEPHRLAGPR
jgi:uncharacterized protein